MNTTSLPQPVQAAIATLKADVARLPSGGWVPTASIPEVRNRLAAVRSTVTALETELYHMERAAHVAALNHEGVAA